MVHGAADHRQVSLAPGEEPVLDVVVSRARAQVANLKVLVTVHAETLPVISR